MYSTMADLSASESVVPYRWPPLPLPGTDVSNLKNVCPSALGTSDTKPTRSLIVDVVAAIEDLGPPVRRLEQIAKRRHGAVVQERSAQPDAVERVVGVSARLAKMRESIRRVRIQRVLIGGELGRVGIEPMRIRADRVDVLDHADTGSFANAVSEPAVGVAVHAVLFVESAPARRERLVDGIRVSGRRERPDPVAHAFQPGMIDGDRCHAGAEGRAEVALVHRVVVAVPVKVHAFARRLVPQRRIVGCADQFRGRQPIEPPVELNRLVRVERVDSPAPPPRNAVLQHRGDAVAKVERLQLQPIHQPESHQDPFEQREASTRFAKAAGDALRGRAVVERAREDELDEAPADRAAGRACRARCAAGWPGESRRVLVWQTAQLNPTCSTPKRRRRETPMGRSFPGSKMKPNEA